jgi:hypothetical protein
MIFILCRTPCYVSRYIIFFRMLFVLVLLKHIHTEEGHTLSYKVKARSIKRILRPPALLEMSERPRPPLLQSSAHISREDHTTLHYFCEICFNFSVIFVTDGPVFVYFSVNKEWSIPHFLLTSKTSFLNQNITRLIRCFRIRNQRVIKSQ